jgi:phage tail-like protein
MSAATSLISGLADTMKNMLFGGTSWPMSKFYFYVIVGATELGFQSVEGLEAEIGVIEYRDGNSPILAKERIPGMITYSKVTLKKGMFSNDTNGANWFKELATDRLYTKRRNILIALLDHNHIPQFIWRYEGCFITKFTPANLDAESDSEIAVEEMEFVGRTFTTETLLGMAAGAAGAAISGAMNISF